MMLPSVIPTSWKIGAALLLAVAIVAGAVAYRHHVYTLGYDAAVSDRAARDLVAVVARVQGNAAISIKQDSINAVLTKVKNEELAPVVQRIYVDRVRIGPASCGPAATAQAKSAGSGDGTDSPGRLVREDVERDTRALTEAVERELATGRACQAFVRENGFAP